MIYFCPDKNNPDFKEMVEVFGKKKPDGKIDDSLAYHLWHKNKGWPLKLTREGDPSELFNSLKDSLGSDKLAMIAKSKIFTNAFKAKYGDWEKTGKEPLFNIKAKEAPKPVEQEKPKPQFAGEMLKPKPIEPIAKQLGISDEEVNVLLMLQESTILTPTEKKMLYRQYKNGVMSEAEIIKYTTINIEDIQSGKIDRWGKVLLSKFKGKKFDAEDVTFEEVPTKKPVEPVQPEFAGQIVQQPAKPKKLVQKQTKLKKEEKKVDTEPTEAQKEAGNYKMGHIWIQGLDVSIENPKGSVRSGTDRDGKEWSQEMQNSYGYLRGTGGADKDHIDVFMGNNLMSDKVFVIDQVNPKTGVFDEHKVMLGFDDRQSAKEGYFANYEEGWNGFGSMAEMSMPEFKTWAEGRTIKPINDQIPVKDVSTQQGSIEKQPQAGDNAPSQGEENKLQQGSPGSQGGTPAEGTESAKGIQFKGKGYSTVDEILQDIQDKVIGRDESKQLLDDIRKFENKPQFAGEILKQPSKPEVRQVVPKNLYNFRKGDLIRNTLTGKQYEVIEAPKINSPNGKVREVGGKQIENWNAKRVRWTPVQKEIAVKGQKKSSTINPESRTGKALSVTPHDFTEAVLQFFLSGGRINTEDLISHTGFKKGSTEFNKLFGLHSKDGTHLDVISESLPNSFGVENKGAMDSTNEVIDILNKYPSRGKMLAELERRIAARDNTQVSDIPPEEDPAFEYEDIRDAEEEINGLFEDIMKNPEIESICKEYSNNDVLDVENLLKEIDANPKTFTIFPFALKQSELSQFKAKLQDEQSRRQAESQTGTDQHNQVAESGNGQISTGGNQADEGGTSSGTTGEIEIPGSDKAGSLIELVKHYFGSENINYRKSSLSFREVHLIDGRIFNLANESEWEKGNVKAKYQEQTPAKPQKEGINFAKRPDGTLKTKSEYTPEEWKVYTDSVIDKKLSELPKEKEFWEMTRDEFINHIIEKAKATGYDLNSLVNEVSVKHKEFVSKAISEGKSLPQEVLADYPELKVNSQPQFASDILKQESKAISPNPVKQAQIDRIITDYNAQISEKQTLIPKAEEAMHQALLEADNRNGLFGDANPVSPDEIIKRDEQGFTYNEATRAAVRKPFEEKIIEANKEIATLTKERESKIGEVLGQQIMDFDTPPAEQGETAEKPKDGLFDGNDIETIERSKPQHPIQDFGEHISGAKKELRSKIRKSLEVTDQELLDNSISKTLPVIDYADLVAKGVATREEAALLQYVRNEIGVKPRQTYKQKRWLQGVKAYMDMLNWITDKESFASVHKGMSLMEVLNERMKGTSTLNEISDYTKTLLAVGFPENIGSLGGYKIINFTGRKKSLGNGQVETMPPTFTIVKDSHIVKDFDTWEEAAAGLKYILATQKEAPQKVKFDVWSLRGKDGLFVGKKVGPGKFITLASGFTKMSEVRKYIENHQEELEKMLDEKKIIPYERPDKMKPRIGPDHRGGQDVTPEQFSVNFGFRGVQFGNYVEQGKRQEDLNEAYDALMDLTDLVGISPKAISLGGQLGIAFGARGSGGKNAASAHYEPGEIVINLTKNAGAGSLAHEWFHAVDNYFERQRGKKGSYITDRPRTLITSTGEKDQSVRPEVLDAFNAVVKAINASGLPARSQELDARRTKDYWSTTIEMAARSFESYVVRTLDDKGIKNDYLASFKDIVNYIVASGGAEDAYPYPTNEEAVSINMAFKNLFSTIRTKEGGDGISLLYEPTKGYQQEGIDGFDSSESKQEAVSEASRATEGLDINTGRSGIGGAISTEIKPRTVLDSFKESGYVDVIGQPLTGPQDLADLWSIHRSPYIEKSHVIFVKDGKVIGSSAFTINKSGMSLFVSPNEISRMYNAIGSDGVYYLHNHPSGHHEPSEGDVYMTLKHSEFLKDEGMNLIGHVIIDHDKFSYINVQDRPSESTDIFAVRDYTENQVEEYEYKNAVPRLFSEREELPEGEGAAQRRLFEIGKSILTEGNYQGAVVYLTPHLEVSAYDVFPEGITEQGILDMATEGMKNNLGAKVVFIQNGEFNLHHYILPEGTIDHIDLSKGRSMPFVAKQNPNVKFTRADVTTLWDTNKPYTPEFAGDMIKPTPAVKEQTIIEKALDYSKGSVPKAKEWLQDKIDTYSDDPNLAGKYKNALSEINASPKQPEFAGELLKVEDKFTQYIPGLTEGKEFVSRVKEAFVTTLAPYTKGGGKEAAEAMRGSLGAMARNLDIASRELRNVTRKFDTMTKDESADFIDRMEHGLAQPTQMLQDFAATFREILDGARKHVQDLGTGKLDTFNENYFPRFWEQGVSGNTEKFYGKSKRPLEGPKSFLKKRVFEYFKDGIDAGYTPVTYNPATFVLMKLREMERYVMAHRALSEMKKAGFLKFVGIGGKKPEGYTMIDDRISRVMVHTPGVGLVYVGNYYADPNVSRIFNNFLSRGLRGNMAYDLYRGLGNALTQFQLGLSAFHLGFTSFDSAISKVAIGLEYLYHGEIGQAAKAFAMAPVAPITNIIQGNKVFHAWMGDPSTPEAMQVAQFMEMAGGRAKMDDFYKEGWYARIVDNIKKGRVLTGLSEVPLMIIEQTSRPILEYIVPRQKMGVFMDMAAYILKVYPNDTFEKRRERLQDAWDSVDNRMGQLVYDNLFWDHTTKDIAMAMVRSVGWNLGTFREVGGAPIEGGNVILKALQGKTAEKTHKIAYLLGLVGVGMLSGAVYMFLRTGERPKTMKDYFFPKSGEKDSHGNDQRSSMPTYIKDLYHYSHDFPKGMTKTLIDKLNPVNNIFAQMVENKDYYGTKIWNEYDPIWDKIKEVMAYLKNQFKPFGIRNIEKTEGYGPIDKVLPFVGITPAPYDINITPTERLMQDLIRSKFPIGGRTPEQAASSKLKSQLRNDFVKNGNTDMAFQAVTDGRITPAQLMDVIKGSLLTPLERNSKILSQPELAYVFSMADEKSKRQIAPILATKISNKMKEAKTEDEQKSLSTLMDTVIPYLEKK